MISKRARDALDLKKKLLLKSVFKKVVRGIIINSQWLDGENDDDTKISSNAKRNIALLVRAKRKIGMLTAAEKTLIRTPHLLRTIADRKKLCTIFAALRCFFWVPPKIRARLVPVLHFMSLSAGRTIMRQGDKPLTIFFIVSGEVEMIRTTSTKTTKKFESKGEVIFGPGDCIGEVAMIEGCPRTHSFITTSQCELLVLFDTDFISILKPYMQKIWNEKKKAFKALDYFDFLTEEQILNACKLSSIRQFKPLDTIYSHDKGSLTNVHFVLSGECVILQCLKMKVTTRKGKKVYELIESKEDDNLKVDSHHESNKELIATISKFQSFDDEILRSRSLSKLNLRDIELRCADFKRVEKEISARSSRLSSQHRISCTEFCEEEYSHFLEEQIESDSSSYKYNSRNQFNMPIGLQPVYMFEEEQSTESTESEIYITTSSSSTTSSENIEKDESHFIDVGSFTFGGIFGLGEKMQQRVIMARSTVQCLILPRHFLLDAEQNPGNVWRRRLFYLDCMVPSRESLFKNFLKTLKWKKFKHDYIQRNLPTNKADIARGDDIPIICRIEEDLDDF